MRRTARLAIWAPIVAVVITISAAILKILRLDARASRNRGWPDRGYRWPHRNYR